MTTENKNWVAQRKNETRLILRTNLPSCNCESIASTVCEAWEIFYQSFDGVIKPTGVEVSISQYDSTIPDGDLLGKFKDIDTADTPFILKDSNGVTSSIIRTKLDKIKLEKGKKMSAGIKTTEVAINIYLNEGYFNIDPSKSGRLRFNKKIDEASETQNPSRPPIKIKCHYLPVKAAYGYDHPIIKYVIDTRTDIWFEDTLIGQINRARFHECFERLDAELGILSAKFFEGTVGISKDDANELFEYDGPPSETLIERHRREWVAEHLRPTETRSNAGDTQRLEWEAPDGVPKEELRTRVEVYVGAHPEEFMDIDRICVTQDDTQMCADIDGGTVAWERDEE